MSSFVWRATRGGARTEPGVTPLEGSLDEIGAGLREIAEAGADELILVLDPITEASIRGLGDLVGRSGPDSTSG